ncbi:flagellar assembly protein FliW [Clostridium sp. JN-9]|uniref:flagellar assembly protein FliW n=1 Tax=Clostridium sp. JN-9 TaxID=2507159 RepID=UPI000FFE2266|nr:flagellar assembly protein FliW [Clostridium sp. JN-9]QAT40549.1 flagellar assembly protein FliW [Clostridium sp. JN-9]
MKLSTKYHGIREYQQEDIITFNKGIPGFEGLRKFILFTVEDNNIFSILHSIEDETIGIILVSPFNVDKNYEFNLDDEIVSSLKINDPSQVLVLNTVTLNSDIKNITVNLKAPIVINNELKLGEQVILDNEKYQVKHPLFTENKK